ncbi:ComEA family DNA-binding protein [Caulifigura coniformis]|nr:helix-hairpin-helix domain-containing protein [Caulifigura coniformis]
MPPRRPQDPDAPAAASELDAPASLSDDEDTFLQWTRQDRWFLAVLALAIVVLLGIHFARLGGWGLKPLEFARPESRKYEFQLEVNGATWVEWMQLEGIGEATARKIVAERDANGPFRSVDDVARVKGIGPATLEKIRPWLRHESHAAEAAEEGSTMKTPAL